MRVPFSKQLILAITMLCVLSIACTRRICPAYSQKATHEQRTTIEAVPQKESNNWES